MRVVLFAHHGSRSKAAACRSACAESFPPVPSPSARSRTAEPSATICRPTVSRIDFVFSLPTACEVQMAPVGAVSHLCDTFSWPPFRSEVVFDMKDVGCSGCYGHLGYIHGLSSGD
ncbi:unnamed protein product [Danaus chrysippus]|uniref:(African queen) hypothetical protein n=1 Tax=Danaus chrysippus TaxID=151541 RepID=A0A8J2QKS0_9NEOP|nr:unnamed protein product [Danaus chrysippus]